MDRGVDGYLNFRDAERKPQFAIVSVKGGDQVSAPMIRDLKGTVEREKAAMGLFISLAEPTREMTREAASAGIYETGGMRFPKLQILTIAGLFAGRKPQVPFGFTEGFRTAPQEKRGNSGIAFLKVTNCDGRISCFLPHHPSSSAQPISCKTDQEAGET